MTVKRTFLNIGIILTVIALAMLWSQIYENSCMVEAEGTVGYYSETPVTDAKGNIRYVIVYDMSSSQYRWPVEKMTGYDFAGYDFRNTLSVGDKVTIYCDKRTGEPIMRLSGRGHYIEVALFCIPGIILIILGFSSIKGYWSEFFCKYPLQFFFSVITWVVLIYLWVDIGGFADDWYGVIIYLIMPVNAVLNAVIWSLTWFFVCKKKTYSI